MKSFADWTDDIAQSVGEVKHHWETDDGLEPRWQAQNGPDTMADISDPMPGAPYEQGTWTPTLVPGVPCPDPNAKAPSYSVSVCQGCHQVPCTGEWVSPATGMKYEMCDHCGTKYGFSRVMSSVGQPQNIPKGSVPKPDPAIVPAPVTKYCESCGIDSRAADVGLWASPNFQHHTPFTLCNSCGTSFKYTRVG